MARVARVPSSFVNIFVDVTLQNFLLLIFTFSILGEISKSPKQRCADDHPMITIETTDEFRLTADPTSLHVALRKSSELTENSKSSLIST